MEKKETTYDNGQLHNRWYERHITADSSVKDGMYATWYKDGEKKVEGEYMQGVRHGTWTSWYQNGQKSGEGRYVNGKKEGKWLVWNENGKRIREVEFADDTIAGIVRYDRE